MHNQQLGKLPENVSDYVIIRDNINPESLGTESKFIWGNSWLNHIAIYTRQFMTQSHCTPHPAIHVSITLHSAPGNSWLNHIALYTWQFMTQSHCTLHLAIHDSITLHSTPECPAHFIFETSNQCDPWGGVSVGYHYKDWSQVGLVQGGCSTYTPTPTYTTLFID